jgi:cytochrome c-type biogenesis protein CcmH/NrfG
MPIVWTAQPWLLYAQALWWTGDWVKAVKASQKALEIEPNNEEVKAQFNGMNMTARKYGKI